MGQGTANVKDGCEAITMRDDRHVFHAFPARLCGMSVTRSASKNKKGPELANFDLQLRSFFVWRNSANSYQPS